MVFKNGVAPEDWRFAVIVPLYKGKGKRTECKYYRGISLLSTAGKILLLLKSNPSRQHSKVLFHWGG